MKKLPSHFNLPVKSFNGGKFISRREGMHPTRVIDSYEIIYVESGVLGMFEEEERFRLEAGSAMLLYPGRTHGGTCPYPENLTFLWIHFDVDISRKQQDILEIPQQVMLQHPMRMTQLFRQFLADQDSGRQNPLQASLLVMQMLVEMSLGPIDASLPTRRLSEEAAHYIKLHLKEVIGTAEIARELVCNPDYLGRIFKEDFGWTLTDEIHRQRIALARKLLLDSTMNIAEIASESGFYDSGYFRKIFKRMTGIAPLAYRNQYSRMHINTEYR